MFIKDQSLEQLINKRVMGFDNINSNDNFNSSLITILMEILIITLVVISIIIRSRD